MTARLLCLADLALSRLLENPSTLPSLSSPSDSCRRSTSVEGCVTNLVALYVPGRIMIGTRSVGRSTLHRRFRPLAMDPGSRQAIIARVTTATCFPVNLIGRPVVSASDPARKECSGTKKCIIKPSENCTQHQATKGGIPHLLATCNS